MVLPDPRVVPPETGVLMLTGDLVRVRSSKERIVPLYLNRNSPQWLEAAESLLAIFREGVGMTRGEIEEEIDDLFGGGGKATLVHRGLAKVLEDRAEFEVVADVPPDQIREKVFTAAADARRKLRATRPGQDANVSLSARPAFPRDAVLAAVAEELKLAPEIVMKSLFADLRDENRMLKFEDMTAQRLIDRYNVALAQAVLLRSVRVVVEIRNEGPARYRQIFRRLKFHRLVSRVQGTMADGYTIQIDGPLSLFSATTKYGLQMALFLPALLHCDDYRLDAELRWGPRREPRSFHLDGSSGLITHQLDSGVYVPGRDPGVRGAVSPGGPGLGAERVHRRGRAGPRGGLGPRLPGRTQGDRNRRLHRGAGVLEEVEPRPAAPTAPAAWPAPFRPGDLRKAEGR